jgi:hypothetical protein
MHPLMLACLALWVLNDHFFKAAYSGLVTGKLSDVVSLAVFPLLPVVAMKLVGTTGARSNNRALVAWVLATGFVMATINLFDSAAWMYEVGLGAVQWPFFAMAAIATGGELPALHSVVLTMDPSDLLTLPALALPLYLGWQGDTSER